MTFAFLVDPQAHDIFQQTYIVIKAALVRIIQFPRRVIDNGLFQLHTQQRPSTTAQISALFIYKRHGHHRAARIMLRYGDNRDRRYAKLLAHCARQTAELCSGRNHLR